MIAVVNLPSDTFKPNKINVKSSLLYLQKRAEPDYEFEDKYSVTVSQLDSLGYQGSGTRIRSFDQTRLLNEVAEKLLKKDASKRSGYFWKAYDVVSSKITNDDTFRFDYKYWNSDILDKIRDLEKNGGVSLASLNTIPTSRGKSPSSDNYVDEEEGYAVVVKSGSNINKYGGVDISSADWIEKSTYDEFVEKYSDSENNGNLIFKGDVLLASTGDGTLGKAGVFDLDIPAIADGHVTILRFDPEKIDPNYLCDYLRLGFGGKQVERLFTGSTGMIELTPDQVDSILADPLSGRAEQKKVSASLRKIETDYLKKLADAESIKSNIHSYLN